MVTSLAKCTSCCSSSLTSSSQHSSCCKSSCSSFWSHRRFKRERRSVCLKPRKHYPLPLPKSVPHLPKTFFTEHLFIDCAFSEESTGSVNKINEETKNESKTKIVSNKVSYKINKLIKAPLNKPRIPAPDFKLRESRHILTHHFVNNVFNSRKPSIPGVEAVNILISCKSSERIIPKRNKILKTDRNRRKSTDKNLNAKKLEVNVFSESSYQNTYCSSENISVSSSLERCCSFISNPEQKLFKSKKIFRSTEPSFCDRCEKYILFKNLNNFEVCTKKRSHFVSEETATKNNHLSFCSYCKVHPVYCHNTIFDKSKITSQNIKSEDLQNNGLPSLKNKTFSSSATKIFKKVGFTLLCTKNVLNEQLFNVYSCIINKIEAYILQFQHKSIIECCNSITDSNHNEKSHMLYTTKETPNIQVEFSAHSYANDVRVLHNTNDKLHEMGDKILSEESIDSDTKIPSAPNQSFNEEHKHSCVCTCSCKGRYGGGRWKLFHYTNISESLFFGPTLDEVIFILICCIRKIFEKLGLMSRSEKENNYRNNCDCCEGKLYTTTEDELPDNNNLDVVKWLHDEYLNLAKDVAQSNAESEHNCPCTKDNCSATFQSRRFVLDRLAELLEKKQEIESAYRKKEKNKKGVDEQMIEGN